MGYPAELKSMQSIGYRHVVEFLEENLSWDECVRTLKRDTRRFAKRQFTWFGADQAISWQAPADVKDIVSLVGRFLSPIF
jgi:tRNA dimethylallyltransferase